MPARCTTRRRSGRSSALSAARVIPALRGGLRLAERKLRFQLASEEASPRYHQQGPSTDAIISSPRRDAKLLARPLARINSLARGMSSLLLLLFFFFFFFFFYDIMRATITIQRRGERRLRERRSSSELVTRASSPSLFYDETFALGAH
jgi:hypothetical protein